MDEIKVGNIFAAVFDKAVLDPLLVILDKKSVKFWGTEGTVRYLKSKGFSAFSVVAGFDFGGRVKSLDRAIFARILADRTKKSHVLGLEKLARLTPGVKSGRNLESTPGVSSVPFDLVIVGLYAPDKKNFPESMDIGGQALIRAAIKNYKNVALAFDASSLASLVRELISNKGSTTLSFRKKQAQKAAEFIASR